MSAKRSRWSPIAAAKCWSRIWRDRSAPQYWARAPGGRARPANCGRGAACGACTRGYRRGSITVALEPGLELEVDADLFSQVNRAQNLKLVTAVMEMAEVGAEARVLDLFCGAGNFSLPAARRGAAVMGVDAEALAVAAAAATQRGWP